MIVDGNRTAALFDSEVFPSSSRWRVRCHAELGGEQLRLLGSPIGEEELCSLGRRGTGSRWSVVAKVAEVALRPHETWHGRRSSELIPAWIGRM